MEWNERESERQIVCVCKKWGYEDEDVDFNWILSMKLVAHGGWCIDDNGNTVNTWWIWWWPNKTIISKKKKIMAFSWII